MGEVVNVLVAFAVIVFLFRWVTSSSDSTGEPSAQETLGFRPKNVTQAMVDTVHNMFPDMPTDNIRYDLLRTGNVELTVNKIMEKGFLEAPPAPYFTIYPRTPSDTSATRVTSSAQKKPKETLISRYSLQGHLDNSTSSLLATEDGVGGKAVWEESAERREASLKERKARMILAARQRMLEQQQKTVVSESSDRS